MKSSQWAISRRHRFFFQASVNYYKVHISFSCINPEIYEMKSAPSAGILSDNDKRNPFPVYWWADRIFVVSGQCNQSVVYYYCIISSVLLHTESMNDHLQNLLELYVKCVHDILCPSHSKALDIATCMCIPNFKTLWPQTIYIRFLCFHIWTKIEPLYGIITAVYRYSSFSSSCHNAGLCVRAHWKLGKPKWHAMVKKTASRNNLYHFCAEVWRASVHFTTFFLSTVMMNNLKQLVAFLSQTSGWK